MSIRILTSWITAGTYLVASFCLRAQDDIEFIPPSLPVKKVTFDQARAVCNARTPVITRAEVLAQCAGLTAQACYNQFPSSTASIGERRQVLDELKNRKLPDLVPSDLGVPAFLGAVQDMLPGGQLVGAITNSAGESAHTIGAGGVTKPLFGSDGKGLPVGGNALGNPSPGLSPAIREHLERTGRGATATALGDGFDPTDDLLLQMKFSPNFWFLGRSFDQYVDEFDELSHGVTSAIDEQRADRVAASAELVNKVSGEKIESISPDDAAKVIACAIDLQEESFNSFRARHLAAKTNQFSRLVNNQPQLVVTYRGIRRTPLVGARVDSYGATLEFGLFNSLSWLEWIKEPGACWKGFGQPKCLEAYTDLVGPGFFLDHDIRFMIGYEKATIGDISVDLPLAADVENPISPIVTLPPLPPIPGTGSTGSSTSTLESFSVPGAKRNVLQLGVGGTLTQPTGPLGRTSRLDLVYENHNYYTGQIVRGERKIWRLTFTYKVAGVSIPLNLLYRSRNEFEVDAAGHVVGGIGVGLDY